MKIVIIHGQSHKGSTYHIAHMLAEKISSDIKEFFLPKDFGEFCVGCTKCYYLSQSGLCISCDWGDESFFRPLRIQMDGA